MILRQTFDKPINGYWDGGARSVFDWRIEREFEDKWGTYVKIGSWEANYWFHVAKGKTDKQTLSYAKRYLARATRARGFKFEYIEEAIKPN